MSEDRTFEEVPFFRLLRGLTRRADVNDWRTRKECTFVVSAADLCYSDFFEEV